MPGFPAMCAIQPIVGSDMHKAIPSPPPAPPPFVPHVIVWGVGLSQKSAGDPHGRWRLGVSGKCTVIWP